jgi:ArsR family transcriptional regulator, arsenate/arsenite/antimonite-responsive transcriptional repressor
MRASMAAKNSKKIDCCTDVLNLPEEMEEALRQHGGLDGLRLLIPSKKSLVSESDVFHALSDPIRLQILHSLRVIDMCPCILKEITELSDSKLSYHLNILEKAGLISSSPRKRWRIYILTSKGKLFVKD